MRLVTKLKLVAAGCVVLVLVPVALVYGTLRSSLPQLDGEVRVGSGPAGTAGAAGLNAADRAGAAGLNAAVPVTHARSGLTSAVTIERDNRGVPTITARTRTDLAYATGFIHAQDRFFQMDLSRRLAA